MFVRSALRAPAAAAQRGEMPVGKEPFILGRETSVCLMAGHRKRLAQRGPKIIFRLRRSISDGLGLHGADCGDVHLACRTGCIVISFAPC